MNEIQTKKQQLREYYKALRKEIKTAEKDAAISSYALALSGASFFVYFSFGSEADTHELIQALLNAKKTVCLPRVARKEMKAVRYTGGSLKKGAFGIEEPLDGEDTSCAVALVPLLAVDLKGNRLGYGGGYYDGYFKTHPDILRVGLCYEGQVVSSLPAEDNDVPLQAVITEKGLRYFGKT